MVGPAPSVRPRPSGGFSQGLGNFSDEHLDESAMQKAMAQKSLQQQQTSTTPPSGKGGTNPLMPPGMQQPGAQQPGAASQAPQPPREVSGFVDELVKRPAHDIVKGLASIFDINALLGIGPTDTPEQQQQKQQFHQRYQQLTTDEKQETEKRFNQRMREEKQKREEEEMKKQQERQKNQQAIALPKSPKKGPVGPASSQSQKANMTAMMEQDRKTLGNAGKKF